MAHIALSYSRSSTYERCPRKFKSQYIDKDYPDDSDNFFFKKGKRKHDQLDNYIKTKSNPMIRQLGYDSDVEETLPMIDRIITGMPNFTSEQQLAVDLNFQPCDWFSKSTAWRAIVDFRAWVKAMMLVVDWKTGKVRDYDDSDTGQLHITAAMMFAYHPEITDVTTTYAFIEHKHTITRAFDRTMDLRSPIDRLFEKINEEKEWAPKANEYCKYCLLTRKQCKFSCKD